MKIVVEPMQVGPRQFALQDSFGYWFRGSGRKRFDVWTRSKDRAKTYRNPKTAMADWFAHLLIGGEQ